MIEKVLTYNVPSIPQITVSSHHESHRDDLQDHFSSVNQQKNEVNCVTLLGNTSDFPVNGQEKAVYKNNDQNKPIEPWVNGYKLNNFVSERVCYREAAQ